MSIISQLQPEIVWKHFQVLCDIPRPSKHEGHLRDYLIGWAELKGLATVVDAAGNLIIRKPATPGYEDRPGVVLQSHLDMVCQANSGVEHDFFNDPIRPELQDGWLVAENTTLGADNGIGVALALAALDSDDLAHGPLEALFTVDEEAGMGGALGLEPGLLQGKLLINIDTEEWGEFYLGCAGGVDVNLRSDYASEALPDGYAVFELALRGLKGGHSGIDIHLGRGNAIKLLARLINRLVPYVGVRLMAMRGGTARNALAREAFATVAVPAQAAQQLAQAVQEYAELLKEELAGADEGITLAVTPGKDGAVLSAADQARILALLQAAPHGVKRMSVQVEGVVETSNNCGVLVLGEGKLFINFMVRSLRDSGYWALADEIGSLAQLAGCTVEYEGAYPGWAPNPDSRLLALFQQVYGREYGGRAETKVIHAGLECGILGSKYPGMDMVSFGPDIRGAHAPGERVNVASVGRAWHLLQAVLTALPAQL
jgi:dipeptidase D